MAKIDLAAADKMYYQPPKTPVLVELSDLPYLSIEGRGAPGGPDHAAATAALYTLAYGVKFAAKSAGDDFTVAKLEGQWWWDDRYKGLGPSQVPREEWLWRLLLRQPSFVDAAMVERARLKAAGKKPSVPGIERVRFETITEGLCVQILHVGPFAEEDRSAALVEVFMREHSLKPNGWHHEIYLTDFRKTPQERQKTILRQPVKRG